MEFRFLQIAFFAWILLSTLCLATPCKAHKIYQISYSAGTAIHALARERVKTVYERAGLKAEFIPLPHKRSLLSANQGIMDAEVGRISGLEKRYPNLLRVNVKLLDLFGAAYVLDESPITIYRRELLDTVRTGAIFGVQWSLKELDGRDAEMTVDYDKLIGMLIDKRMDMALGTTFSVEAALKRKGYRDTRIRILEPLIFCEPLYHYVHKKHAHLIPLLEKTLRELWEEDHWGDNAETNDCSVNTDHTP